MAKPIDHGIVSGTATTLSETAKGGILGIVATIALGALVGGGLLVGGGALFGALFMAHGALGGAAAMMTGFGGAVTSLAALAGGLVGVVPSVVVGLPAGAAGGLAHGINKVRDEKGQYKYLENTSDRAVQSQVGAASQQAYAMGMQAGQQSVVQELQRQQYASIQQQMAANGPGFASKVEQQRAATAAAGKQI